MLWSEIKKWAKQHGYETTKINGDDGKGIATEYHWSKVADSNVSGVVKSVSKLAKAIYNDMTNKKWIEHQERYVYNQTIEIKSDVR